MSKSTKLSIIISVIIGVIIGILITVIMMNIYYKESNSNDKTKLIAKENKITEEQNAKSISSGELMFPLFPGDYGYDSECDIDEDGSVDRFEYVYVKEYYEGYFDDHGQYFIDEEAEFLKELDLDRNGFVEDDEAG